MDAREAIDRIRSTIPREAGQPLIFQFDPERRPIMSLSVSAANRGLDELRLLSETMIEPMFERIQGVASAETQGGAAAGHLCEPEPRTHGAAPGRNRRC